MPVPPPARSAPTGGIEFCEGTSTLSEHLNAGDSFFNVYSHDLVRVAIAVPPVRVANPDQNADQTLLLMRQAQARHAVLVLFPELGLSAYSCDDLFHQRALLDATEAALLRVVAASAELPIITVIHAGR